MVRFVVLVAVVALLALPAVAIADIPVEVSPQPAATPVPAPEPTTRADNGVSNGQLLAMGAGVIVLIGGIWVVIMRDARKRVPEHRRQRLAAGSDEPGARGARAKRRKPSPAERRRRKRSRAT